LEASNDTCLSDSTREHSYDIFAKWVLVLGVVVAG
jgi:hypothetical protein